MKVLLKIAGSIVILLIVVLGILRITGLNPVDNPPGRPGLWLRGNLVTTPVADWSFTDKDFTIHIQTHTAYLLPHSVPAYCSTLNGHLYVGSSQPPVRHWDTQVLADPHVRLGIENNLYDVTLVPLVTDSPEYNAVLAARLKKYPKYRMRRGTKFILFRAEQGNTTN